MRRRFVIGLLLLTLSLAAGCDGPGSAPKFQLTDVTGASFGKELNLTDFNGKPRTLADFRGKVVAIFFGYTHCPDICPTTLAELGQVAQALGTEAQHLQVLFVTLDPERDTPAALRQYVSAFNPDFLGLYGDAAATARAAKDFKIFYQKQPATGAGGYTLDHSAGTYILDRQGRLRLFAQYGAGAQAFLHDIRALLQAPA